MVSWLHGQSEYTKSVLGSIPGRDKILARIQRLDAAGQSVEGVETGGGRYFYLKTEPSFNSPKLFVRDGLGGAERVLVDPERLTRKGVHYAIDYFTASRDGRYVAYALSPGGSEDSVLHVIDAASGRNLAENIDRAQYGDISWRADGRSFFYVRLQKLAAGADPIDRYKKSRVYLHTLGANPDNDKAIFGYGLSPRASMAVDDDPGVLTMPDCDEMFGVVAHGVANELTVYMAPLASAGRGAIPWRKIVDVPDGVVSMDVHGSTLFLLTHKEASRFKIVSVDLRHPELARARIVVAPSGSVITALGAAGDALYVETRDGGIGRLLRVDYQGGSARRLPLPFEGAIGSLVTYEDRPGALFMETGWTHSALWYRYDPRTQRASDTGLKRLSPIRFTQIASREVKARGADGTPIPLSIVYPRNIKLDGSHPLMMEGYGAYGSTIDPAFDPTTLAWLERGGVLAYAHVRGGGEYGEDWHRAGMKQTKPNTWRDLIACGEYLIAKGYTSPKRLAIEGASAGGITVGRALTERPDLFGAAIDLVGVSNPVRQELSPNGPPNIPEFGSALTPNGFRDLLAMDAYHHVQDGVKYPAVLLTTGINDPRVASWEPAKLAARLQAATVSGKPILLRVDYDAGHGMGSTKAQNDAELADEYAFLLHQFGVSGF
ncbi:prolyl oligopeptidase [Capsulimonas corticalis]|uniref:prolyl oligopeptidase n=2 Tax=Capsulimonas corticalis TaxID=2219043 RepID=A0A402CTD7_9BACT|nr:prolyl oligopeptidase [Capsulimonas corticalis]